MILQRTRLDTYTHTHIHTSTHTHAYIYRQALDFKILTEHCRILVGLVNRKSQSQKQPIFSSRSSPLITPLDVIFREQCIVSRKLQIKKYSALQHLMHPSITTNPPFTLPPYPLMSEVRNIPPDLLFMHYVARPRVLLSINGGFHLAKHDVIFIWTPPQSAECCQFRLPLADKYPAEHVKHNPHTCSFIRWRRCFLQWHWSSSEA